MIRETPEDTERAYAYLDAWFGESWKEGGQSFPRDSTAVEDLARMLAEERAPLEKRIAELEAQLAHEKRHVATLLAARGGKEPIVVDTGG